MRDAHSVYSPVSLKGARVASIHFPRIWYQSQSSQCLWADKNKRWWVAKIIEHALRYSETGNNKKRKTGWIAMLRVLPPTSNLDGEQSLFFFRFSKGSARPRECWAAKPRNARNEGGNLSRLAPSVTRVVIWVSRAFCATDQAKRETARSLHQTCLG